MFQELQSCGVDWAIRNNFNRNFPFLIYKSTLIFCVKSKLNFLCEMFVLVQKPIRMVIKFDKIFLVLIEWLWLYHKL